MKTIRRGARAFTPRLLLLLLSMPCFQMLAGVGVSLTPSAVSNTYNGYITLQVTGLSSGQSVTVQKFLDANANGVIDSSDSLVQQFTLTDGQAGMTIDGITNVNVPGDTDTTSGQITSKLAFGNNDFFQLLAGKYLYKVSSPTGAFAAQTNTFAVTNFPFGQTISGTVVSNGTTTTLPGAGIILFPPPRPGHHDLGQPVGGAYADNTGAFSIQAPAGSYQLLAFKSNFLANASALPSVTISSGASVATNLSLLPATATISGKLVDSTNASLGLPGLLMTVNNNNGFIALTTSDSNGNFIANVQSGAWQLGPQSGGLLLHGFVDPSNGGAETNAGDSGVTLAFAKASALFYGTVKDSGGNPIPNLDVNCGDQNQSLYDVDVFTDPSGVYVIGVVGGLGNGDLWSLSANGNDSLNYVLSQPAFDQSGGTNIAVGQAVQANLTGLPFTFAITGNIQAGGTNLIGVSVNANYTSPQGDNYFVSQETDVNGDYTLNVGPGVWSIDPTCQGGNGSLDSILGSGNYFCPNSTNVTIGAANATANFTVQFATYDAYLSGIVVDSDGNPVPNINLFAFPNGSGTTFPATTAQDGTFRMGIDAGSYFVQLNNDPTSGTPALGLVSPSIPLTVNSGVNISNFRLVAQRVTGTIDGSITNTSNNSGVSGVSISANATVNGTNYQASSLPTDSAGKTSLAVCDGSWNVSADCTALFEQSLSCPNTVTVNITSDTAVANLQVSGGSAPPPPPSFSSATLNDGHFQATLSGSPDQNYTVQSSTNLNNWTLLLVTNPGAGSTVQITDSIATNGQKFYRILVGP